MDRMTITNQTTGQQDQAWRLFLTGDHFGTEYQQPYWQSGIDPLSSQESQQTAVGYPVNPTAQPPLGYRNAPFTNPGSHESYMYPPPGQQQWSNGGTGLYFNPGDISNGGWLPEQQPFLTGETTPAINWNDNLGGFPTLEQLGPAPPGQQFDMTTQPQQQQQQQQPRQQEAESPPMPVKRGRGRPRKTAEDTSVIPPPPKEKRGPGRPLGATDTKRRKERCDKGTHKGSNKGSKTAPRYRVDSGLSGSKKKSN